MQTSVLLTGVTYACALRLNERQYSRTKAGHDSGAGMHIGVERDASVRAEPASHSRANAVRADNPAGRDRLPAIVTPAGEIRLPMSFQCKVTPPFERIPSNVGEERLA